jgi:hypothetical protein
MIIFRGLCVVLLDQFLVGEKGKGTEIVKTINCSFTCLSILLKWIL